MVIVPLWCSAARSAFSAPLFQLTFDTGIVRELPLHIRCRHLTCERGNFAPSSSPRHSAPTPAAVPVGRDLVAPRPTLPRDDKTSCLALMGSALPSCKLLFGEPGGLRYARAEL